MSKWPVAWAISADSFNSLGVMEFFKKEIIMLFGPPQYVLSDNGLNFDCKAVQDFANRFNIQWKCTSTYNTQGNGVAEHKVGTLNKALQKSLGANPKSGMHPSRMYFTCTDVDRDQMDWLPSRYCSV